MSFWRKKEAPIEARRFTGVNFAELEEWIGRPPVVSAHEEELSVVTADGTVTIKPGMWLVMEPDGCTVRAVSDKALRKLYAQIHPEFEGRADY